MTKYDPYDGLKPKRGRMPKGMRQRWGALAAAAFGLYIYNINNRSRAYGGGTNLGTARSIEFSQPSATTMVSDMVRVAPGNTYDLGMSLSTSALGIEVQLHQTESGHTVRVSPKVDGLELDSVKVDTTNSNGVATIQYSAEEMNVIKNSGVMVTSIEFRVTVDGDYGGSFFVRCPIGA